MIKNKNKIRKTFKKEEKKKNFWKLVQKTVSKSKE